MVSDIYQLLASAFVFLFDFRLTLACVSPGRHLILDYINKINVNHQNYLFLQANISQNQSLIRYVDINGLCGR